MSLASVYQAGSGCDAPAITLTQTRQPQIWNEHKGAECRFARGETLFSEGDVADHHYRILSGAVRLFRMTSDGRRQITGFRLPGEILGFEWGDDCEVTAEAASDVVAIRCSRVGFSRAIDEQSQVRNRVIDLLRHELCAAQAHLMILGRQSAEERVVSFLIDFAKRCHAGDGTPFDLYVTREDMADYLGLTFETVSRTLSGLKRDGYIELPEARQVVIRRANRLQDLVAEAS